MIYDALLGTSCPDYVASFGNSDVYNAADWVKIIDERDETVLQAVIQSSVTVNQHHLIGGGRWGGGGLLQVPTSCCSSISLSFCL